MDFKGNQRLAYYLIRRFVFLSTFPNRTFYEDFSYGMKTGVGSLDPEIWKENSNSPYSYSHCMFAPESGPILMLSPGRNRDDFISFTTIPPIMIPKRGCLDLHLGYRLPSETSQHELALSLHKENKERIFKASVAMDGHGALLVTISNTGNNVSRLAFGDFGIKREELKSIRIIAQDRDVFLFFDFSRTQLAKKFVLDHPIKDGKSFLTITNIKTKGWRGFVQLDSLSVKTLYKNLMPQATETMDWFVSKQGRSQ